MLLILSQDGSTLVDMTGAKLSIATDNTMISKKYVAYYGDINGNTKPIILGYYETRDRIIDIFANIMKTYKSNPSGATFKMPY